MSSAVERLSEALRAYGLTLFYAVDPGALAAMRPVFEALEPAGRPVRWVLDGWSLSSRGAELEHWTLDTLRAHAAVSNPTRSAMILGSQTDFAATRRMIRLCTAAGIDTLFLFDHWSHYEEHFLDPSNGELVLPNVICLMDRFAAREMAKVLAAHGDRTELLTVGHPALEAQVEDIRRRSEDEIRALRQQWNVESGKLQAFLLEPLEADFPEHRIGYSEYSILEYFFEHLADPSAVVIVRPHPRQDVEQVRSRLAAINTRGTRHVVSDLGTAPDLIAAADEVFGMTSIALILSIMSGKPTKSVQVGRTEYGCKLSNPQLEKILVS